MSLSITFSCISSISLSLSVKLMASLSLFFATLNFLNYYKLKPKRKEIAWRMVVVSRTQRLEWKPKKSKNFRISKKMI